MAIGPAPFGASGDTRLPKVAEALTRVDSNLRKNWLGQCQTHQRKLIIIDQNRRTG